MLKSIVVTISVFCALSLNAQTPDCKKFKNGTFKMTYQGKTGIVKRYGDVQDEYFNGSKTPSMSFTVKWLDECTYTLTPTDATRKINTEIPKNAVLVVKIIKTSATSYTCAGSFNFDKTKVFQSELVLLK